MEEKVFELLSQMLNEIKDMKVNITTKEDLLGMATKMDIEGIATKEDLKGMVTKEDLKEIATSDDIRRIEAALFKFENKAESKFDALIDGYKQNTEAIYELRRDVENLKSVVEQHEVKLKIVK
ncbi:MAG TPA: hypothetical protein VEB00_00090 [Clostridia bacterium]|nr:hypothetical protein [Clostridia bacterium]